MAFRSAYQSCRPTRCCSAHVSQRVWSGMGGAPHATQSPRDLALSLLSWVLRRFSSLRSGLSSYSRWFCSLASTSVGVGSTRGFGFFTFWLALADFLLDLGLFGVKMTKVLSKMRSLEPPGRQVIQLDLKPLGKLAELNAGQTKSHIAGARPDAPVRFVYAPSPPRGKFGCDPSHCDVRGVPSPDSDIAMLIGDMIAECVLVIHPARLPPDT